MSHQLPDTPPPAIPLCPVCRQPLTWFSDCDCWDCANMNCPYTAPDDNFSLAAYEAAERAKASYLESLDNVTAEDFDDYMAEGSDDLPEDEW